MGPVPLGGLLLAALLNEENGVGWKVSVKLVDTTGLPSGTPGELKQEVEAIYASACVRIDWSGESSVPLADHAARVYLFDRLPAILETRLRMFRGKRPMAVALVETGGGASQTIYVSRSAVSADASSGVPLSPENLGRPLGRVVAHELAHCFVSRGHGRSGILKQAFLPSDLTVPNGELRFTKEVRILRRVAQPLAAPLSANE